MSTVDPFDPQCAICDGECELVHVETRVNEVVRHYRCRGDCRDMGGHIVSDLDDTPQHRAGPIFEDKNELLVADAARPIQRGVY